MTALEQHLLDIIQDAFPLEERPYRVLAKMLGAREGDGGPLTEQAVFKAVENLRSEGFIRRIGGIYDTKKLGFISRLCAGKLPVATTGEVDASALDKFVAAVNEIPAITHNYVRSHEYNAWFTVIAETEGAIREIVERLCAETALHDVHVLSVTKKFKIDTVMPFDRRASRALRSTATASAAGELPANVAGELSLVDKARIRIACGDLPHSLTPFADWGVSAEELREDLAQKRMRRFGAILRHQQAGFAYNAMVCFDTPEGDRAGESLAKNPHVSHCYERPAFEGFPYTLYVMMHAQSAAELDRYVKEAAQSIGNPDCAVLHSVCELKKTSYRYFA